ncbi:MAG TPA: hypothetical protein VFW40_07940 [Capsulimonadaceae bacterium]|nr:hypothetical protein [Capsulimonadaceae bacterium]
MEDAHQEVSDKLDKELNRYIGQYAALFILNEEIELMLSCEEIKSETISCPTVTGWLTRLREVVQDGLQRPHEKPKLDPA